MEYPNFSNAEYINQGIWNKGVAQLISGIHAFSGNSVFFTPGLLNPTAVVPTFNGTLVVQFNLPAPFSVLFSNGGFTGAHGNTTGQDTSVYSLDFTSFVPASGSQTVYVGITYGVIQQDAYTVIGPPIGHPDYSPQFQPYIAYATEEETLILTITTVPPDNLTTVELCRVSLNAGQTIISAVDFTHQVVASLNVPTVTLSGDITGPSNNTFVARLQGKPLNVPNPLTSSFLLFNGGTWVAASTAAFTSLGGDATGPNTNNTVVGIRRIPVTTTAPSNGQNLQYVGANSDLEWISPPTTLPPNGPAGGDLYSNYPNPNVGRIRTIPITSTPPTNGQTLNYQSSPSPILNWVSTGIALYYSYGIVSSPSVAIPSGNTAVCMQSALITLPSTNGWRAIVSFNAAITANYPGGQVFRNTAFVTDNHGNQFAAQMQNPGSNGVISGFDISPFYMPGTAVQFFVYAGVGPSLNNAKVVSTFTDQTNSTFESLLEIFLIPASA